jgi:hypothetical protein
MAVHGGDVENPGGMPHPLDPMTQEDFSSSAEEVDDDTGEDAVDAIEEGLTKLDAEERALVDPAEARALAERIAPQDPRDETKRSHRRKGAKGGGEVKEFPVSLPHVCAYFTKQCDRIGKRITRDEFIEKSPHSKDIQQRIATQALSILVHQALIVPEQKGSPNYIVLAQLMNQGQLDKMPNQTSPKEVHDVIPAVVHDVGSSRMVNIHISYTDVVPRPLPLPLPYYVPRGSISSLFMARPPVGGGGMIIYKSNEHNRLLVNIDIDVFTATNMQVGSTTGVNVNVCKVDGGLVSQDVGLFFGDSSLTIIATSTLVHALTPIVTHEDACHATPLTEPGAIEVATTYPLVFRTIFADGECAQSAEINTITNDNGDHFGATMYAEVSVLVDNTKNANISMPLAWVNSSKEVVPYHIDQPIFLTFLTELRFELASNITLSPRMYDQVMHLQPVTVSMRSLSNRHIFYAQSEDYWRRISVVDQNGIERAGVYAYNNNVRITDERFPAVVPITSYYDTVIDAGQYSCQDNTYPEEMSVTVGSYVKHVDHEARAMLHKIEMASHRVAINNEQNKRTRPKSGRK